MSEVIVRELCVYPVKGCQATRLEEAMVTKQGVAGDRLFALIHEGKPLDQTSTPQLGGMGVEWDEAAGRLVFEHREKGRYGHERREDGERVPAEYVLDHFDGIDQGDEVAAWLSDTVGRDVRLVSAAESWTVNLPLAEFDRLHQTEKSRFYPVSPVSLSSIESLDDLNGRLETPVPMDRFRMNVVVEGLDAWEEDRVESYSSAEVCLEHVTLAERCIIITTDQQTGERKKSDLLQTLNKFRRKPKGKRFGSGLLFGAYLAVAKEGMLRVGDRMEVVL